ncbi:MAG: Fusaric acid resistance protein conserved region [Xanthobacteraceae bacterium]|nr:Fusaric acid resistance protein conserved region [Xanthobacteraceae bacterium]MDF2809408.1 Fusaric acid resistance protein conserved region [Microvirga sp.]
MAVEANGTTAPVRPAFAGDFDWRDLVVSVRLALAAIVALAIAYWLEVQEPQWAILTVYLLPQSSAGAALAKGAFRLLGTILAAICGLFIVKAFSQIPALLVAAAAIWMFACYYGATRMTNFASYGFMLAGYTGLLIIFESAINPYGAWAVAVNRVTAISIGIACAGVATSLVVPKYASVQLRGLLTTTLKQLAAHAAAALKTEISLDEFVRQRDDLLDNIAKFDALRSYSMFELREMRADDVALRAAAKEALAVLAIARSLYLRLVEFRIRCAGNESDRDRLTSALEMTITTLESISAGRAAQRSLGFQRSELFLARRRMASLESDIEAMEGPLASLAELLFIIRRTNKLLRRLSMLSFIADTIFNSARSRGGEVVRGGLRTCRSARVGRREAVLQGTRVALAVLVFCLFWYATEWDQGIAGITGLALMSYQCVNTDNPEKLGWPYFRAVIAACICAYVVMTLVYPWLEGFGMLAAFLLAILVPLGLLIKTPRYGRSAGTFTIYFVAAAAPANVYAPAPLDFVNFCSGLIFGMFVCLMAARLVPVTSLASRREAGRLVIGELLPKAAAGIGQPRQIAREIIGLSSSLLPRLNPRSSDNQIFVSGVLASASIALELGNLRRAAADPAMPEAARETLELGVSRLSNLFSRLPTMGAGSGAVRDEAGAEIARMWAALEQFSTVHGSPLGRSLLRAASSVLFLADRLQLDHDFLQLALTD